VAERSDVEHRLAALEKEVAQLRTELSQLRTPEENWVEKISGSMKDVPEEVYLEFLECCAESRGQLDRQDGEPRTDSAC
jgi:hypothetical protein